MSNLVMWPCYRCDRMTDARRLRMFISEQGRVFLCANCYGDLVSEYMTYGEGKRKLVRQVPEGQEEFPF